MNGHIEVNYCGSDSARMYVVGHNRANPRGTTLVTCAPLDQEMVTTYGRYARWSKQLAEDGYSVLRYHPLGTGESDGSHANITVESLVKDAVTAQHLARQRFQSRHVGYFGVRFGATVSILAAAERPADFLVLWCPVTNLRHYFRELLRSKVTADAVVRSQAGSTQPMIADLEAGRTIDVLGYELCPSLYRQMSAMSALPEKPPARSILWLARPAEEASAAKVVKRWQELGSRVDFRVIPQKVFWEYPDVAFPERFTAATVQWLSQIN